MITLRPTPQSTQDYLQRLDHIASLARPQPEIVEAVQRALLDQFEQNFSSESAAGMRWAALSEATIRSRLHHGYGAGPILVQTGDYRSSWLEPGHANHIHEVMSTGRGWTLSEGSNHPLAAMHERGTGRMPARPVSSVSQEANTLIGRLIYQWLLRTITGK